MALLSLVSHLYLFFFFLLLVASTTSADSTSESAALLKFKSSISGADAAFSTWSESKPPCSGDTSNWAHIRCSEGSIWSLQLQKLALIGPIDVDALAALPSLRTLSLIHNSFDGSLPAINKLSALKSIFLSYNKFSGEIADDAFKGMMSLKKLHLAHNEFTGRIPASLTQLPRLLELRLNNNKFSGQIPEFHQKQLQLIDVSHNALEGAIPSSLAKMNSSYFSGNQGLCGPPLGDCQSPPSTSASGSTDNNNKEKSSNITNAVIIAAVVAVVVLVAIVLIVMCLRKRDDSSLRAIEATPTPSNLQRKASFREDNPSRQGSPAHSSSDRRAETMKLSFVREETAKFDLRDLLKASAEILGSGCFGSSYKAALTTGPVMVVKRFRQMNNVGKEEFQEHMRRLGRLTHPNLLALVAYYYRKEEKLLVSNYVSRGSLAVHLHSNARVQSSLDWPIRLKVIKGVVKGLAYLYNELPSLIAPHGHLKSSNVLLNESYEPLLTDYGLIPVINQESAQDLMVAYKSPEYTQNTRITKKTDVWSLGILILEILTGKFPANFLQKGQVSDQDQDLATWARSVGLSSEVFDKEMKTTANCENEMMKLLKIAMACCEPDVDKRLDMKDVVEKIEEVKEKDTDDDFFSSCASEADIHSMRGQSDEISFSATN